MSTPPPSAAPVDDLPTLVGLLQTASELEHALCCQYLYAAFTLKQGGDPGLTPSQAALTQQWDQQVTKIAIQEMYHLMLASNLLTAVGSTPHLWRPNFPQPSTRFSDVDLPSLLVRLDFLTAKRFMCWEKPDTSGWWIDDCKACADQARAEHGVPVVEDVPTYSSIGALYELIRASLEAHPEWIDPATASKQLTSAVIPFSPTVTPITTYDEARHYIHTIVEEGEGTPDWDSMSHFAYFHQIVVQMQGLGGSADMSWPTVANPVYDKANAVPGATLIDDPAVAPVGVAFNELYLVFVRMLALLFVPEADESQDDRQALANAVTAMMPLVVKPLGVLLTRLAAGPQYPGRYAGPSFELPPTLDLPSGAYPEAIGALSGELAGVVERLQILSMYLEGQPPATLTELATIAARLQTLLPILGVTTAGVPS